MIYLALNNDFVDFKNFYIDLETLLIEVNKDGRVEREIGLNINKIVIHKHPGNFKYGKYGIFDTSLFEIDKLRNEVTKDVFEKLWHL